MAYCKWCGMDSRDAGKCEWCGKSLDAPPGNAPPPAGVPLPARDYVAAFEDENRGLRVAFYISIVGLLVVASALIGWRFLLLPYVILGALFIAGILLGALRILPPIEDEWHEFVIPAILILVLGPEIAFVGYLVYGLLTKAMDLTVVWLLSVYFAMFLLIQIAAVLLLALGLGPETVSFAFFLQMRGAATLGLVSTVFGWGASSFFRPMDK